MLVWDFSGLQLFWGQPHSLSQCQQMVAAMIADLSKDMQQDDTNWATQTMKKHNMEKNMAA